MINDFGVWIRGGCGNRSVSSIVVGFAATEQCSNRKQTHRRDDMLFHNANIIQSTKV